MNPSKAVREYQKAFARMGGLARAKSLSKEERSSIASRAALTRWKKKK